MGGASPLLAETNAQAEALAARLADVGGAEFGVFVAMRHWHPFTGETARRVAAQAPDRVVLLPLYPQFSTTTTASSLAAWRREARAWGLSAPTATICCYPDAPGWVASQADLLAAAIRAGGGGDPAGMRILFSAHGLPRRIVEAGDPYPEQVDSHGARDRRRPGRALRRSRLEGVLPEPRRAARNGSGRRPRARSSAARARARSWWSRPISFVSEHAETLVELDMEYRALAERHGAPAFHRVPAAGTHGDFVAGLAAIGRPPRRAARRGTACVPHGRLCRAEMGACPAAAAPVGG